MLANQASALSVVTLLNSVSCANTAAATSAYVAIGADADGDVLVAINVGTITGTIDFTFSTATDSGGTGAATIVPAAGALAQITTSNDNACYLARFPKAKTKGFLQVIGTIGTGPALLGYAMLKRNKTV
jgi:hypothetical protein